MLLLLNGGKKIVEVHVLNLTYGENHNENTRPVATTRLHRSTFSHKSLAKILNSPNIMAVSYCMHIGVAYRVHA